MLSYYAAGNYRSAIVMLWSVVVCDLLFKLQHLVDLYGDDKAKTILAEIGKLQQANERSSEWESKLVESVAEQTQLLDIAERENLLHLQRQRHLAAHPVVNANFQLHRPNRDTARALIRNALDGLLTKAPILSKLIVGDLVEDLEQASGKRFNEAVRPMLPAFGLDDCIELIRGIETNGQTWERRGAYTDHRELRARALEIDPAFNPAQYAVFNRHLN